MVKNLKIVTDATCHKTTFYKGKAIGAAQFYDADTGELVREEKFVLGEMTPYAAECETVLQAMDIASELTRVSVEVWSDSETLVRHMNGDYLLKSPVSKSYFDKIKQLELRISSGVKYFHHSRSTSLAKAAHVVAADAYAKHHVN